MAQTPVVKFHAHSKVDAVQSPYDRSCGQLHKVIESFLMPTIKIVIKMILFIKNINEKSNRIPAIYSYRSVSNN
jgi:hypothetical protein